MSCSTMYDYLITTTKFLLHLHFSQCLSLIAHRNMNSEQRSASEYQEIDPKEKNIKDVLETFINTINHILIGVTTFYITWHLFTVGFDDSVTYHVWFNSVGNVGQGDSSF